METYILITYIFIDFCKSNTELLSSEIHVRHEKKPPQKNAWLTSSIVNIPQKSSLKPFILWEQPSTAQVAEVTKKKQKWKFCNKLKHLREELGKSTKRIPLKLDEKKTLTGFFKSYPASWNYHLTNLNAKFKWLFDQCPPLDFILFVFYLLIHVSIIPTTIIPKWSNTIKQFVNNSRRIVWVSLTILYFLCNFNNVSQSYLAASK